MNRLKSLVAVCHLNGRFRTVAVWLGLLMAACQISHQPESGASAPRQPGDQADRLPDLTVTGGSAADGDGTLSFTVALSESAGELPTA